MPNDLPPLDAGSDSSDLSKDDILDILSQGEDNEETGQETEGAAKTEEEKPRTRTEGDAEEEEEIKLKGELADEEDEEVKPEDEEELEVAVPVKRKQILEKYPNLFKEFPYLERAYYREGQFTEVFPTIRDAREAADKANILDKFEADVMQGNTERVLLAIKEGDERAFRKAVDNYLPTLAKVDQSAFLHVVGNVIRQSLSRVSDEGKRRGESGEPLVVAAKILSHYMFGTETIEPPAPLVREDETINREREKINQEREQFVRQKFDDSRNELAGKIQNSLKATISANIDPKNTMSEYIRRNASRDAYELLEQQIRGDARFASVMNTLWKRAFEDGFSRQSMDRIKSAYLSKAKTVLPTVIKQSRNDALKGQSRNTGNTREKADGPIALGKTATSISRGKPTSDPKAIPKGMKTLDYLSGND
jgi:hypothetical protein